MTASRMTASRRPTTRDQAPRTFDQLLRTWKWTVIDSGVLREARQRTHFTPKRVRLHRKQRRHRSLLDRQKARQFAAMLNG